MKRSLVLGIVFVATAAIANQQKLSFSPHFAVGQKDIYKVHMDMTSPQAMTMDMTMTQEVTKVDSDGGADLKVTVGETAVKIGDRTINIPTGRQPAQTMHVDKLGVPTKGGNGRDLVGPSQMGFAGLGQELTVGQEVKFDKTTASGGTIKGSSTLVAISDGVAQVKVVADTTDPKSPGVGHLEGTYYINATTSKLVKAETTMSNVGVQGSSMKMLITRQDG